MDNADAVVANEPALKTEYRGPLTARVAQQVKDDLGSDYEVYCNHPLPFGKCTYKLEELPLRCDRKGAPVDLGSADIVVTRNGEIAAVVEIEEATSSPRRIMGDIDAYTDAEKVDLHGKGAVLIRPDTPRLVLFPRLTSDAPAKLHLFREHAELIACQSGASNTAYVDDFEYQRAGHHKPGSSGEGVKAKELVGKIRKVAGL